VLRRGRQRDFSSIARSLSSVAAFTPLHALHSGPTS
jgi:hypothetical protein